MTRDPWTDRARVELLGLRGAGGGWGYRRGSAACAEPTALAGLALAVTDAAAGAAAAADRLAAWQRGDGSVGAYAAADAPGWTTPHAVLLWRALDAHAAETRRACAWLLGQRGKALPRAEVPERVNAHDTSIVGWPWVDATHSWLEPTAMAVLALGRAGLGADPRAAEGLRLIGDRAVAGGGWNYGNKAVLGRDLRPQPGPTGLALLALAGAATRPAVVDPAIGYLMRTLPGVRASASLAWGLIGLRAWGVAPADAGAWLAEAHAGAAGRPDAACKLACLLLASAPSTPGLLGRGNGDS